MREHYKIKPLKELSPEEVRKIGERNEFLTEVRGRVISAALRIENLLNEVIAKDIAKNKDTFKEMILEKEFFTFMKKWQLLRDVFRQEHFAFFAEQKGEFLNSLKEIIETRNRFAHGEIVFEQATPLLEYQKAGKKERIKLDLEYFNQLNKTFDDVDEVLWKLIEKN